MMVQSHAALWWRQCIPACLHLRATRILTAASTCEEKMQYPFLRSHP